MSKLVTDCNGKLLVDCNGKLVVSCPPKDICTEFSLNPNLKLKFTWSGTLTRCTDCWELDFLNIWECVAAPTSLPNFLSSNSCLGPSASLASEIRLNLVDVCHDPYYYTSNYDTSATVAWKCVNGVFKLLVLSNTNQFPMFYAAASNVKSGDVLGNSLSCLQSVASPCSDTWLPFVSFTTGGSYKVEIEP